MSENRKAKIILKIWEYALCFFLLGGFVMLYHKWEHDSDFFPAWLIVLFWAAAAATIWRYRKVHDRLHPMTYAPPAPTPEERKITDEQRERDRRRHWEFENDAEDLFSRLFAAKKMPHVQIERDKGGHYDGANVYAFREPMPLTPDDLYEIKSNPVVRADIKARAGVLYAFGFSSNGGRLAYVLEKDSAETDANAPLDAPPKRDAHALLAELCRSKNIRLTFLRREGSGHDPSPEIWTFGKPIPLTASELYRLMLSENFLSVDTKPGEADGILYADFVRRTDPVVYQLEKHFSPFAGQR